MGLDISASRSAKLVRDNADKDYDGYDDGLQHVYVNPAFPAQADGMVSGWYKMDPEDEVDFRAGSYSGYNLWREQLAALVDINPRDVWNAQQPPSGPFVELINFSDCEGVIGPVTSAKLARDFAEHQAKADAHEDEWFRTRYVHWREAFELAARGGCVRFH